MTIYQTPKNHKTKRFIECDNTLVSDLEDATDNTNKLVQVTQWNIIMNIIINEDLIPLIMIQLNHSPAH